MVKVVSLSDSAYSTLKAQKAGGESFSDVVLRLVEKKPSNLMALFGCAKEDQDFVKGLKKAYAEREKSSMRVY